MVNVPIRGRNSRLISFKRFAKDRKVGGIARNTRDYMPQAYNFSHLFTLFFLRFCQLLYFLKSEVCVDIIYKKSPLLVELINTVEESA
jgi:hypothetical protein